MSGYLARLANRVVGEPTTAMPRVPSLFEGYAGPVAEPDIVADPGDHLAEPTSAPTTSSDAVAAPGETARPERAGRHARQQVEPAPVAAPGPAAASPSPERSGPDPSQLPAPESAPVAQPSVAVLGVTPAAAEHVREAGPSAAPAAVAAYSQMAQPAPTPVVPASPSPAVTPLEVPVAAEPETVVQISIGRVEVRASVPGPAAAPKKPVASPAPEPLALDDYLRGRRDAR